MKQRILDWVLPVFWLIFLITFSSYNSSSKQKSDHQLKKFYNYKFVNYIADK